MKDLNIVFLNYLCKEDIVNAIETLIADIKGSPYDIQITVADNSDNKDQIKEELMARFPEVVYVNSGGNVGFGKGNVVGYTQAEARYYFSINRDTLFPEGGNTIDRLIQYMDAYPDVGCIGPKLLNLDGSLQYSCYRYDRGSMLVKPLKQINWDKKFNLVKKYADRLIMKDFDHEQTIPVDWVLGAAMMVRREVIEDIGYFDDRYFMYLEDADWCRRMWKAGWPVYYVHDIIIMHRHERASAQTPGVLRALWKNKLARIHLDSWIKFLWKWKGKNKMSLYYKNN